MSEPMRLLVTGADGFVGQHVIAALLARGHQPLGAITSPAPRLTTLSSSQADQVEWRTFDLQDAASVEALVRDTAPDGVVHLAAVSSVSESWRDPAHTFRVNVNGAIPLFGALRDLPPTELPRPIVLVGSGEAYGQDGTEEAPLGEDRPLRPLSPYAASKAAQEMLGWSLGRAAGLRLVQTRSFQQMGPGQRPVFVTVDWATQLIEIRAGRRPPVLRVGNVDVVRDFLDVRDAADAYVSLVETRDAEGVFNVCSGRGMSLRDLLEALQRAVGVDVEVEVDPARLRPVELASFVGDPSRLMAATGWNPRRPLAQTLTDVVRFVQAGGHE